MKRFVSIWFRYLQTDWISIRQPDLKLHPFVLSSKDHGRMIVTALNHHAESQGIFLGMAVADAKAVIPGLRVMDEQPGLSEKILKRIAVWCIRFTPCAAIDLPEGILLDATGCAHLWGNETNYLNAIISKLNAYGYTVKTAMADTIGAAWAISRFGKHQTIIEPGQQKPALLDLPAAALRFDADSVLWLEKSGLRKLKDFIDMPSPVLFRRFGPGFLQRIQQAIGNEEELIHPVIKPEPYDERLPCIDPIVNAGGIEIALKQLLERLCRKLRSEEMGLRRAECSCFCIDGRVEKISITTNKPSASPIHLFKLFEIKIPDIEPGLGIELFILKAQKLETVSSLQQNFWEFTSDLTGNNVSELLDRLENRLGPGIIRRYLPDEHYLPERSVRIASSLKEKPGTVWKNDLPRPLQLLRSPEPVDVTAPIPDYPPMLFRYKGRLHKIIKADGPERIEQEWWLQEGQHRDYYYVEDEDGKRYWLFRSGHYDDSDYKWYLHGFFG